MLVKAEVRQDDRALDPGTDLQRVDLGSGLREQLEAGRAVRPGAEQGRHLDAGGAVRLGVLGESGRWVELGEGGEEANDRGVLDEEVGEPGQFRGEAVPGSGAELGEGVGDAPSEELDEFGGEPFVEPAYAEDGVGDPPVVGVAKRLDGALELGSRFEGEGVEEGDGVELSVPLDEAGLSGDALYHPRGKEGEKRLEVVVGRGARVRRWGGAPGSGLPDGWDILSRWASPHEPMRFQWKPTLTENA
jgi:hypothetical protein